jgi:hypothetical protein
MIAMFAFCTAGGFAMAQRSLGPADGKRTRSFAILLLAGVVLFIVTAFALAVETVGWQRTEDYALQRIERDGVMSKGGDWNQLQESNIPIALGTVAISGSILICAGLGKFSRPCDMRMGGLILLVFAVMISVGITAFNWCGWSAFLNPRWMAHGIREMATYPVTGIPIALAAVLLVESYVSGETKLEVNLSSTRLIVLGAGIAIALAQLLYLRKVNILAVAQHPAFAPDGLSVSYLLCSHVFEHFLDFVIIGPLAGGLYALVRLRGCRGAE